jgi:hypothetical protein
VSVEPPASGSIVVLTIVVDFRSKYHPARIFTSAQTVLWVLYFGDSESLFIAHALRYDAQAGYEDDFWNSCEWCVPLCFSWTVLILGCYSEGHGCPRAFEAIALALMASKAK